jgi:hypothetical protein
MPDRRESRGIYDGAKVTPAGADENGMCEICVIRW